MYFNFENAVSQRTCVQDSVKINLYAKNKLEYVNCRFVKL